MVIKTRSKKGGVKTRSGANGITKKSSPVKEKDICPICLEELKKKDNIPKLPCKHKFHKDCLVLVCNGKHNINVPCPICRGDITNSCIYINPLSPPTRQLSPMSFNRNELMNMTMEERRQNENEFMRDRRNYLARRRRAIARETPQQRDQRVTVEERLERAEREERDRYFHGVSQARRDQNSRNILSRGFPLPESPPTSPDYPPPPLTVEDLRTSPSSPISPPYAPNSPPYPPPGYEPNSPPYPPPGYEPNSPPYAPGSPQYEPNSPPYALGSPQYEPNSPPYAPGSPQYEPNSPPYVSGSPAYSPPPPLTMEDLRTDEPATYSNYDYFNGGKKSRKKSRKGLRKTSRKGLRRKSRK